MSGTTSSSLDSTESSLTLWENLKAGLQKADLKLFQTAQAQLTADKTTQLIETLALKADITLEKTEDKYKNFLRLLLIEWQAIPLDHPYKRDFLQLLSQLVPNFGEVLFSKKEISQWGGMGFFEPVCSAFHVLCLMATTLPEPFLSQITTENPPQELWLARDTQGNSPLHYLLYNWDKTKIFILDSLLHTNPQLLISQKNEAGYSPLELATNNPTIIFRINKILSRCRKIFFTEDTMKLRDGSNSRFFHFIASLPWHTNSIITDQLHLPTFMPLEVHNLLSLLAFLALRDDQDRTVMDTLIAEGNTFLLKKLLDLVLEFYQKERQPLSPELSEAFISFKSSLSFKVLSEKALHPDLLVKNAGSFLAHTLSFINGEKAQPISSESLKDLAQLEIEKLREQHTLDQQLLAAYTTKIKSLKSEVDDSKKAHEKEKASLQAQIRDLEEAIAKSTTAPQAKEKKARETSQDTSWERETPKETGMKKLQKKYDKLVSESHHQVTQLKVEIANLKASNDQLKDELEKSQAQLVLQKRTLQEKEIESSGIKIQLADTEEQQRLLLTQIDELLERTQTQDAEISILKEKLAEKETTEGALEELSRKTPKDLKDQLAESQAARESALNENIHLRSSLATAIENAECFKIELADLGPKFDDLKTRYETLRSAHEAQVLEYQTVLQEKIRLTNLFSKDPHLQNQNMQIQKLKGDIKISQTKLKETQDSLSDLTKKLTLSETETRYNKKRSEELTEQLKQINSIYTEQSKVIAQMRKQLAFYQQNWPLMDKRVKDQEKQIDELAGHIQTVEKESGKIKQSNNSLTAEVASLRIEKEKATQEVAALQDSLATLIEQNSQLQHSMTNLLKEVVISKPLPIASLVDHSQSIASETVAQLKKGMEASIQMIQKEHDHLSELAATRREEMRKTLSISRVTTPHWKRCKEWRREFEDHQSDFEFLNEYLKERADYLVTLKAFNGMSLQWAETRNNLEKELTQARRQISQLSSQIKELPEKTLTFAAVQGGAGAPSEKGGPITTATVFGPHSGSPIAELSLSGHGWALTY